MNSVDLEQFGQAWCCFMIFDTPWISCMQGKEMEKYPDQYLSLARILTEEFHLR